jgi:DNA ligase (NAD+)
MTRDEAQLEIARLSDEIRRNDQLYYVEAAPTLLDHEYDYLVKRLKELEEEFPDLILPTSPTQRIGEKLEGKAEVVQHTTTMLSIENVYDDGSLREFVASAQKNFNEPLAWVCELKIDGVAASLFYERGVLTRALTRGDGQFGEDVTANVRTIRDVPLRLQDGAPDSLEVRGEIYMTNENLARLNDLEFERALAAGREFKPYANSRNLTSGTIKQRDPAVCAERRLQFFAHSTGADPGAVAPTHFEFMQKLRQFGFSTAPFLKRFEDFEKALEYVHETQERLHELDFEVDGFVLKVDDFNAREEIGTTSKYPKWTVACKFEKYEAQTTVRDIVVQIGKSGVVTPVAELEPVEIAGTTVSRATLHNAEEIERKDVRVGDAVIVEKAGKIIPHIVRVETYLRSHENPPKPFEFPEECPSCGYELKKDADSVFIRCGNPECAAQFRERLAFFASKDAMDIDGVGPALVERLTSALPGNLLGDESRLVRSFADLYRLTPEDLMQLEGIKQKSAANIVEAIQGSKSRGPARLLAGISIAGIGVSAAKKIIKKFRSFDALEQTTSPDDFLTVEDVGTVLAQNLFDFFHSEEGLRIVADLRSVGLDMALEPLSEEETSAAKPLEGKTICATGTLDNYDRSEIKETIERFGGKASSSVSKKTTFLLVGSNPGAAKVDKAAELGVPTITEEEFQAMIEAE